MLTTEMPTSMVYMSPTLPSRTETISPNETNSTEHLLAESTLPVTEIDIPTETTTNIPTMEKVKESPAFLSETIESPMGSPEAFLSETIRSTREGLSELMESLSEMPTTAAVVSEMIPTAAAPEESPAVVVASEMMDSPTAAALEESPMAAAPEESPTAAVPEESPMAAAPEESPTAAAPEESPTGAAPEESPTGAAPEESLTAAAPEESPASIWYNLMPALTTLKTSTGVKVTEAYRLTIWRKALQARADMTGFPSVIAEINGILGEGESILKWDREDLTIEEKNLVQEVRKEMMHTCQVMYKTMCESDPNFSIFLQLGVLNAQASARHEKTFEMIESLYDRKNDPKVTYQKALSKKSLPELVAEQARLNHMFDSKEKSRKLKEQKAKEIKEIRSAEAQKRKAANMAKIEAKKLEQEAKQTKKIKIDDSHKQMHCTSTGSTVSSKSSQPIKQDEYGKKKRNEAFSSNDESSSHSGEQSTDESSSHAKSADESIDQVKT